MPFFSVVQVLVRHLVKISYESSYLFKKVKKGPFQVLVLVVKCIINIYTNSFPRFITGGVFVTFHSSINKSHISGYVDGCTTQKPMLY